MLKTFLILLSLAPTRTAMAEEISDKQILLAEKSALAWQAYECSVLAEKLGKADDQTRLFKLGYNEGLTFLNALEQGILTEDILRRHGNWRFTGRLGGPSYDFMLGRTFEAAIDKVYDEVFKDVVLDGELLRARATVEYSKRNCSLLK